jgi:hypothetical protein
MKYHVELSPTAEKDIKSIGAFYRRGVALAIRGILVDPEGDPLQFKIADPLWGVVVGNVVVVFRFMTPDELAGVHVPGRYVIRVGRQDELEEIADDLASMPAPGKPTVRVAAEDLLRALRTALRDRI